MVSRHKFISIAADVFFVDGIAFLLTVAIKLKFLTVEHTRVRTRDGGAAVVHRGSVPRPQQHCDNGEGHRSNTEPTKGSGTAGGGRFQCGPGNTGGGQEGGRHCDDAGDRGTGGNGETLPA